MPCALAKTRVTHGRQVLAGDAATDRRSERSGAVAPHHPTVDNARALRGAPFVAVMETADLGEFDDRPVVDGCACRPSAAVSLPPTSLRSMVEPNVGFIKRADESPSMPRTRHSERGHRRCPGHTRLQVRRSDSVSLRRNDSNSSLSGRSSVLMGRRLNRTSSAKPTGTTIAARIKTAGGVETRLKRT